MPKPAKVWSAEIVISAIKELHERDGTNGLNSASVQRHYSPLYLAARTYLGGWRQAIEATGIDYSTIKKKTVSGGKRHQWSRIKVVKEIIARAAEGKSIKGGVVSIEDIGLYNAARSYFGKKGWAKARVTAGFPAYDPRPNLKWTQITVQAEIQRLHHEGVPLNHGFLLGKPEYGYLRWAAQNVFGSWRNAVEAAGYNYEAICIEPVVIWTKEAVIDAVRSLDQDGVRLSSKSVQIAHGALFAGAVRAFGCWSKAVENAGISYQQHCRVWSTKAWLRRMESDEYTSVLERASTHTRKRRK
jgi:hypothetical protein